MPTHLVVLTSQATMDPTPHVIDPEKILTKTPLPKQERKEEKPKIEVEVVYTPEPEQKKEEAKPQPKKSSKTLTSDVDEEGDLIEEI